MRLPTQLRSLLAAALLAPLLLPGAAGASAVTAATVAEYAPRGQWPSVTTITWTADPGEVNRVEIAPGSGGVVLRDAAGPIRVGGECRALPDGAAVCNLAGSSRTVVLRAGDGDDEVRVGLVPTNVEIEGGDGSDSLIATDGHGAKLDGGPGDDVITGSSGNDAIAGGAGADRIEAGAGGDTIVDDPPEGPFSADLIDGGPGDPNSPGQDSVRYQRTSAVHVDLGAGVGGAPGEGDRLSGIENADGGSGDDVLIGDEHDNALNATSPVPSAAKGADRVEGRGGDDDLRGDAGALLFGGAGDDRFAGSKASFDGGSGDDSFADPSGPVRCGDGRDGITGATQAATVAPDCESVQLADVTVDDLRVEGARLRLTLDPGRTHYAPGCGFALTLRGAGADTRLLARRVVPMRAGRVRSRTVTLVLRQPPRALVRIVVQRRACRGGRTPRVGRPSRYDGFLWQPPAATTDRTLARQTAAEPLRERRRVG
ncbi:hypothetical protein VSS74_08110 [Conexibacter stalactiti]|uniref:Calcium-binding protein n=1 Tax=Conexibacter stalactiti TaxID=1940611 RepID=A0ABU4HLX2_9ACTN|nr:hypothetical protein [Conexibacter stalactiti]MDW5594296.1 hypothetical protein [Conexibacter stalactiti]MEC5034938.1 hypothetical protein [Conexibacter stalactiti]